jgi:hypothetical protein
VPLGEGGRNTAPGVAASAPLQSAPPTLTFVARSGPNSPLNYLVPRLEP